jgi:hypothetical protein
MKRPHPATGTRCPRVHEFVAAGESWPQGGTRNSFSRQEAYRKGPIFLTGRGGFLSRSV